MASMRSGSKSEDVTENIQDIDVSTEMRDSFLEYAYSVIYARALPDARDGLKPVQRRILYQMQQMGLTPRVGHVKSQRVVGEVMGKLHPHGDAAIYDALVRLAQDFNLRLPLVDGHGNFGSLDDGPAAARYTEARLAAPALLLTDGLSEDAVNFVPNYDSQFMQPEVLPARFPSLLVNGASGIAVGMATQIAPHNPAETIRGALHLLDHPDATTEELMRFIPGPDFPGGGVVAGLDGVVQAYESGRGIFKVRGKVAVERITARRKGIIISELPYMVGPERVIDRIKDGVKSGRIKGISAVSNLTDRHHGLRLVVELKSGVDPQSVLELLYRYTPLEESFAMNAVALVDGQPKTLTLKDMLSVFIDHRLDVSRRVHAHAIDVKGKRLHLVEGLLLAVIDIDEVIAIIRQSEDAGAAKERLMMAFDLSEVQAEHILELRLRRLTKLARIDLETEKANLVEQLAHHHDILNSEELLRKHVAENLEEVLEQVPTRRRTVLLEDAPTTQTKKAPATVELADEPCTVVLTPDGRICRIAGAEPPAPPTKSGGDLWSAFAFTTVRGEAFVVDAAGLAHRIPAEVLPGVARSDLQQSLAGAIPVDSLLPGINPIGVVGEEKDRQLVLGTRQGVVKAVRPQWPANTDTFEVVTLAAGDEVVGASNAFDTDFAIFITKNAQVLRFPIASVRPQGPAAGGVAGIRLDAGDEVIFFAAVEETPEAQVLTIAGDPDQLPGTDVGRVKRSLLEEFPVRGRATKGSRGQRFLKGDKALLKAWAGPHEPVALGPRGGVVALAGEPVKRDASGEPPRTSITQVG